jgi:hypothetical protein
LAKRSGRIAGLRLELHDTQNGGQPYHWAQPLQILSGIPGVQLEVLWVGFTESLDHPRISQWLAQHGQLISHLIAAVFVREDWLQLRDFAKAAAPCRSIDLIIKHLPQQVVDLADLDPVAGSLHGLVCQPSEWWGGRLRGTSAFNNLSQLTGLHLGPEDFGIEEPWGGLANLTGLRELTLRVSANGDPSPLSALTRLSYLSLAKLSLVDAAAPFTFSSLQPLSTLRQLEVLHLGTQACGATSLQGLAGLSVLRKLELAGCNSRPLRSLEGIPPGVTELSISSAPDLVGLAGIEGCTRMEKLSFSSCEIASLQPLRGLSSLKQLNMDDCNLTSLEGLNSTSLQSLSLTYCDSLTQLSGVKHLSAVKSLKLIHNNGLTTLRALSQLGEGLQKLTVYGGKVLREEVLELPHVQPTADVDVKYNTLEVVLAGGAGMH